MRPTPKAEQIPDSKTDPKEKISNPLLESKKKEKLVSIGIYVLIIVVTVALMLILINL